MIGLAAGAEGVGVAHRNTAAAAHALVVVDGRAAVFVKGDGVVGAVAGAGVAAAAQLLVHGGFAAAVHLHFAGAGTAARTLLSGLSPFLVNAPGVPIRP